MYDAKSIQAIEGKYLELLDDLDERGRRRWAAVEARALGHGGISAVARATGLAHATIRAGLRELDDPPLSGDRQRHGVYDIPNNEAAVSVGISHDTAEFAVAAIRRWWLQLGRKRYGKARRMLITADSGGGNSSRCRLWKLELQRFADESGMMIEVCHYPPGTSKWNRIEHRVFCHITRNRRGVPLETLEVVVQSIGATTTETGLEIHAWLDEGTYDKGRVVSDEELAECNIKRNDYHGEWNYEIHPHEY